MQRTIHWGETDIAAGVPGDLVVDAESRASFGALDLLRSAQSLVSTGKLDLLIGIPSTHALPLAERVGFRRVSVWQSYAQIVNSRERLRSRFGRLGAALSPLADSSAALLRTVKSRSVPRFMVVELSRQGLDRVQMDNWQRPNRCLVSHASSGFLRWRFLDTPVAKYRIFAGPGRP